MGPARSSIVPGGSSRKLVLPLHHTATLFFPLIRLLAIHARRATSSVACAPRCLQPPSTWFLWLEPPLSPSSAPFILLLSPGCLGPSRSRTNEERTGREEAGILSRHSNSCLSYSHPRSILFNLILSTCLALCVCR